MHQRGQRIVQYVASDGGQTLQANDHFSESNQYLFLFTLDHQSTCRLRVYQVALFKGPPNIPHITPHYKALKRGNISSDHELLCTEAIREQLAWNTLGRLDTAQLASCACLPQPASTRCPTPGAFRLWWPCVSKVYWRTSRICGSCRVLCSGAAVLCCTLGCNRALMLLQGAVL